MKTTPSTNQGKLAPEQLNIKIDILGIDEPIIYEYFARLNNSEYMTTAELFAEQGCLNPPFDKQVQGRQAIAQYLDKEARGIKFLPEYGEIVTSLDMASNLVPCDLTQYQIQGKVEINCFIFNTSWLIELNAVKKIMLVEVKLLTSLDKLLNFSRI